MDYLYCWVKMQTIEAQKIRETVKQMCQDANFFVPDDVMKALEQARKNENSETARIILSQIIKNNKIGSKEKIAVCQDTGLAVFFVELGQDVHIIGGSLTDAINEGVRLGYKQGYLRKSTCDPFTRKNIGDNTPAIVHVEYVSGDKLIIRMAAKGGGSENMSTVKMMKPADGKQGIAKAVVDWVIHAGANPCPPTIVGVGIGGNFEQSAILAKKSLFRKLGTKNPDPELAEMEEQILNEINKSGIGPMGLGGRTTSLEVHIIKQPCHIASLPLAINIQCHSARHKEAVILPELHI